MKPQAFTLHGRALTVYQRPNAHSTVVLLPTNAWGVKAYLPLCEEAVRAGYRLMACHE